MVDLIKLGFVDSDQAGSRYEIPAEEVARLKAIPYAEGDLPPALVVCVTPATPDEDPSNHRKQAGWDPQIEDPYDQVQLDGVRQWWPVRHPDQVEVVVVTNHGWIVHAYEVAGEPTQHTSRARWSFPVVAEETPKARAYLCHRLEPKPGPIAYPLWPL